MLVHLQKSMLSPVPAAIKTDDAEGQQSQVETGLPDSYCLLLLPMRQPCSICRALAFSPAALFHVL